MPNKVHTVKEVKHQQITYTIDDIIARFKGEYGRGLLVVEQRASSVISITRREEAEALAMVILKLAKQLK